MCVAIAKPAGKALPTQAELISCEWSNRDGAGVAWADGQGLVQIKKDFKDVLELHKWLVDNIRPEWACLIHFRQATSGGVSDGMRHPFPITEDVEHLKASQCSADLAMIHNGVIWTVENRPGMSDTAILVTDVLAAKAVKENLRTSNAIQVLLEGLLGASNKVAFLWPDKHIMVVGEFHEHNGVLFSNKQYETGLGSTGQKQIGFNFRFGSDGKKGRHNSERNKWRGYREYDGAFQGDTDYCVVCYQEYLIQYMRVYAGPDAIKGDLVCPGCVESGLQSGKITKPRKRDVLLRCGGCDEWVDNSELVSSLMGGKNVMLCAPCEAQVNQLGGES